MSLSLQSLRRELQTPVGSAGGAVTQTQISKWLYGTADAAATVEAAGYFNGARSYLTVGDAIDAVMATGGTPVRKSYVVLTVPAAGSNVTIGLQTTSSG